MAGGGRPVGAVAAGPTWPQLRAGAVARLGSETEVGWLIEEVTGDRWSSGTVSERTGARFRELVERRAAGEPLQYVIGRWGFRTLDLMVDRRVLIPRPETEQVVEVALGEFDRLAWRVSGSDRLIAVDLGTGSGAIALALVAERTRVEVWATDVSPAALDVARANLAGLGGRPATRVRLAGGSWWAPLPAELRGRVDLVVSNPPYVATAEMCDLEHQVAEWEPALALEAGPTGLEGVAEVLAGARDWLQPAGVAVVEIAPQQAGAAVHQARAAGFTRVEVKPDLAGRDRVLVAGRTP